MLLPCLSRCAGASAASLAFNLFRSHPWDPQRPLVDLDLVLLLLLLHAHPTANKTPYKDINV
jgi:hypothetical protein